MDTTPARELGAYLRSHRETQRLTTRQLAARIGVQQSTIVRIEHGEFRNPRHDILRALAEALQLPLNDLLSLAGYIVDNELPGPMPFLRAKYLDLPEAQLQALSADVASVLEQHGIDPYGRPSGNEDEAIDQDEPAQR